MLGSNLLATSSLPASFLWPLGPRGSWTPVHQSRPEPTLQQDDSQSQAPGQGQSPRGLRRGFAKAVQAVTRPQRAVEEVSRVGAEALSVHDRARELEWTGGCAGISTPSITPCMALTGPLASLSLSCTTHRMGLMVPLRASQEILGLLCPPQCLAHGGSFKERTIP